MYPGQSRTTTRSVCRRAIATVSSVLDESTTMSSSAHATDASASPTSAASFLVMTVTESFGTRRSVTDGDWGTWGLGTGAESVVPSPLVPDVLLSPEDSVRRHRARPCRGNAAATAAERHLLHGLEIDQRLVVVGNRLDFGGAGEREVALRLEDEEGRGHSRRQLLFLGFQLFLLQFARCPRRLDALLVGLHVARDTAHLCRHLHFEVLQLCLRLLELEPHPCQVGVRDVGAKGVVDRDADGPIRIRVLEDVAEHRPESALRDDAPRRGPGDDGLQIGNRAQ